jgi:pyruvate dehydrogenase (quinone)
MVDCVVNPHEPPLPGKIEFTQAKGFAEAFLRGQPDKLATARTLIKDQVDKLRR